MKLQERFVCLVIVFALLTCFILLNTVRHEFYSSHSDTNQKMQLLSRDSILSSPTPEPCKPHDNIVFLKTQRCASSTLQNILYRWGDERNLVFVLPKTSNPYMGNPKLFNKQFAVESADGVFNILANHARYNEEGMAAIMPDDSIYITILRNPVSQFESVYDYDEFSLWRFHVNLTMFLRNTSLFINEPAEPRAAGRNSMMFDLGLDARALEADDIQVTKWIQHLENKFHLVLITDHLDESLILLKDILCWSIDDILYLRQNARKRKNRTLSEETKNNIRNWNSVDSRLYDHFNKTLWEKVEAYGVARMRKEVAELQRRNNLLTEDCVGGIMISGDRRIWYPAGVKIESFKVKANASNVPLCKRVTRPENEYIILLRDKLEKRNRAIRLNNRKGVQKKPLPPSRLRARRQYPR